MSGVKMWACASTTGGSMVSTLIASGARHRIFVGVEHPAGLFRKIHAGRGEDIHQLVARGFRCRRSVDGGRRDHCNGGRRAVLVIIIAPVPLVRRPGPADVMRERTLDGQGALLEIIMVVQRKIRPKRPGCCGTSRL